MISIVIPVLNEERFLPGCLRSLKSQDYTGEFEIIIADNGSTDNSVEIAKEFGVKIVPCPEKKSVFYARQVGADSASGDIIIQADADTLYPPGWLSGIAGQFATHPEVVAITGRFIYRDPPSWSGLEYRFRHYVNRLTGCLLNRPLFVSGATFAFRRREFLAVNGYRDIAYAADQYGIAGRLSKIGKVLYDKRLFVITSARTVNKPFISVVGDGSTNFRKWCLFLATCCLGGFREFTNRSPSRRMVARLSIPAVCLAFFAVYGYFIPVSPVFGKVFYKANVSDKVVALSFDDGPNEPYTSEILDILARYDVKATFFLVGRNVEIYPETARRIISEGHVVGNHSYSHNANHALTEYGSKDLLVAQAVIFTELGVSPHLYRPPHGKKTPWELQNVQKAGLIEVTWSVSTSELAGKPASAIAEDIVKKTDPGEIILLHDGYGTSHNTRQANKSITVEALPQIIEELRDRGYDFVTVPKLLSVPAYNNQN